MSVYFHFTDAAPGGRALSLFCLHQKLPGGMQAVPVGAAEGGAAAEGQGLPPVIPQAGGAQEVAVAVLLIGEDPGEISVLRQKEWLWDGLLAAAAAVLPAHGRVPALLPEGAETPALRLGADARPGLGIAGDEAEEVPALRHILRLRLPAEGQQHAAAIPAEEEVCQLRACQSGSVHEKPPFPRQRPGRSPRLPGRKILPSG